MIYIASDHGGFELKKHIIEFVESMNLSVKDMGAHEYNEGDDYPDYVIPVMRELQNDPKSLAILICKNGVGVSILANRYSGVRCALSWSASHAKSSREDDNSNVLALPAEYIDTEAAQRIVTTWLNTPFSEKDRHKRRLQKVEEVK